MAGESILIIDDNATNLKLANLLLSVEGYAVRTAIDATDAMKVLENFQPKLILMDLQLPGKNGFDLTKELKSNPAFQHVLIVALTAYAMKGDEEKAIAAGCDGYMTKPISVATFPDEIAQYSQKQSLSSKGA